MPAENHSTDPISTKPAEHAGAAVPERLHICSFESRRADEMQSLIERSGAKGSVVRSMRELSLDENSRVFDFADELLAGNIDVVVFMTGVGARALAETVKLRHDIDDFYSALRNCCVIARGPKPVTVLREWKVPVDFRAAEPNTWRELLAVIDSDAPVAGKRVAVQEYGQPNEEFEIALKERGARVIAVPVYRWALPADTKPLKQAIHDTLAGEFNVLMFTSANQLKNVLSVAGSIGLREEWLDAARNCVIASIGPTASETLREAGLPPDVEASPPKMGQLVRQTVESAPAALSSKKNPHDDLP